MKNEKIREGFYFFGAKRDFFVETAQQVKSRKLARKIAEAICFEADDYTIENIFRRLQKAWCKDTCFTNSEGKQICGYEIYGENFAGYGSVDKTDGKTIIIKIKL